MLALSVILAVCFRKPIITCVAGLTESKTSPEWITRSTSLSRMASTARPYASCTSTSRWFRPVSGQSFAYRVYPRCVSEICAIRTMVSEILTNLVSGSSDSNIVYRRLHATCTPHETARTPAAYPVSVPCLCSAAYARRSASVPLASTPASDHLLLLRRRTGRRPRQKAAPLPRSFRRCIGDDRYHPGRWTSTRSWARGYFRLRTPRVPSRSPSWFPLRSARPTRLPAGESRPILPLRTPPHAPVSPPGAYAGSSASTLRSGYRPLLDPKKARSETLSRANPSSCRAPRGCARRPHRCGGSDSAS